MVEPKQKPASKPVHTADQARIPRTAMRAVWLRTREGTRQLLAEDCRDGQYQDAADREERAVDVVSLSDGVGHRCRAARRQKAGTAGRPKEAVRKGGRAG